MDSLQRSLRNSFVTDAVNRMHHIRTDADRLATMRQADSALYFILWNEKVLLNHTAPPAPVLLGSRTAQELHPLVQETVFLGETPQALYFALGLIDDLDPLPTPLAQHGEFHDLRAVATALDPEGAALLAQAKAMVHWHRQQRFCGRCGSPTLSGEGGYHRTCTDPKCGQQHFPRVDPAIIVLVTRDESCLLGRQPQWPAGRYSNIAGFVEPGESLESAVQREVWEETSIKVARVHYHSSQPWPFPSALMLGFTAEAASEVIHLNDGELQDARWFTRDEITDGLMTGVLKLPSPISISYHLIEDWFNDGSPESLAVILQRVPEELRG